LGFTVLCVLGGALLAVVPFLLEYEALAKAAQARELTTVASLLKNLEGIAAQISSATGKWQDAQEQADKTAAAAREIAERMTGEVRGFTEFMQRANDSERANLRLEVDKLRRAESDWLQTLVRTLDHVYALHLGACRSGQSKLIEQVGQFQAACRDAARRVGLVPFSAGEGDAFDAQRHQLAEEEAAAPAGAVVGETVATGYTFQGRLVRPAVVRLLGDRAGGAVAASEAEPDQQPRLPLEAAEAGPK
jgi:molecular chaperone GrpE (heat shock protein)